MYIYNYLYSQVHLIKQDIYINVKKKMLNHIKILPA